MLPNLPAWPENPFDMYRMPVYQDVERVAWIQEQLKRFTYKPGWRFSVRQMLFAGPILTITFPCEDTYNPGSMIHVAKNVLMSSIPHGDEEEFAKWLAHEFQDVEIHESREWLKRDGKIFDDPHA